MSYTLLKSKIYTARKKYSCDAYIETFNRIGMNDLTNMEKRKVKEFEVNGGCINIGDKYHYIVGVMDGDFMVFRASLVMYDIYMDNKIYEE